VSLPLDAHRGGDADSRPAREAERTLPPLEIVDLGRMEYGAALARQEAEVVAAAAGGAEKVLVVEHPAVYTLGRSADERHLGEAPARLGVPVFRVGRGGEGTFHGPGQLVAYPILRLGPGERDVHRYLRALEESIIRALGRLDLLARRLEGKTGVWIGEGSRPRKIASIGIGVRRWVTFHGIAINVTTDLEYFRAIVPCALPDVEMTSVERELGRHVSLGLVRSLWIDAFAALVERSVTTAPSRGATPRRGRRYAGRISAAAPGVSEARKPPWIRAKAPAGEGYFRTRRTLDSLGVTTVCQEAMCPNIGECWGHQTATFMLLGESCTRSCGFCAVKHGAPTAVDASEPERVAEAARRLGLEHVVVTSVNRDDLADGGAAHFAATARAIKRSAPGCAVEVLIPDFQGDPDALAVVVDAPIDVLNHNTETVPRLYARVRPGARYERSLELLSRAKRLRPELLTKSGLMAGLGEQDEELFAVFQDLRRAGCDILTVGQYLRPTREHLPVVRFVTPETFAELGDRARSLGFGHVESGPLVRSSYHAWSQVPPRES
jgi:lipoyl synthase